MSAEDAISDVELWKIIINGYPYKTEKELGCANKEEAFTATKQAIYCYLHGNNPNDYKPIGEAGIRTLNALNMILENAKNSSENQISNTIKILEENKKFEVDEIEKNYLSKTYSINAGTTISNYKVVLEEKETKLPEGIKITDLNGNQKDEFNQYEKFKILIPIKNIKEDIRFKIKVDTKINNKPILYGKAPNSSYQDYALTGKIYEDAKGEIEDICFKNETKIKIIKQDADTNEFLENVEFKILDEQKQPMYANLKTDENGEVLVKNIIPGKYYVQEINAKEGYLVDQKLIEIDVHMNEEFEIIVYNKIKEDPEPEVTKQIKSEENIVRKVEKKLPVTGM